jgi:tetratricopeptide (TPR) repeat protein
MRRISCDSHITSYTCCSFLPALLLLLSCMLLPLCGCQRFYDQQKKFYLEKGRELFSQGDYIAAEKKLKNALVFDERCAEAMYIIGQCNFEIENYPEAMIWFRKAGAEQPNNLEIQTKIAEVALFLSSSSRARLKKRAKDAILSILEIDPKNTRARQLYLEFLISNYSLTEAESLINDLLKEGKQDTRFYKAMTEYYLKKTQYPEALKTALENFTFNRDWMKTITNLIQKLDENNDNEGLILIYNKILEQVPEKVPYQEALSKLYRKTQDKNREEQLFLKLLQSNPEVLQVKLNYIDFLIYYKQQSQAKAFLDLQLKKDPEETTLTKSLVNYYIQTQQSDAAVRLIQASLTTLPHKTNRYIELQNMLASIYFDNGDFDAAATIAREVVRQSPVNREAIFLLCKISLIQGDVVNAIGALRRLSNANPEIAEYHYYLGLAHEMRDESVLAERELREALDLNPNYKEALKEWLAVYPLQGVLTEVETRIDRYKKANPTDKDIIALRAEFLKRKEGSNNESNRMLPEKPEGFSGLP